MKDEKQFWNKTARKYAKSKVRDQASYEKKLAMSQQFMKPSDRVLEFGCGTASTAIEHASYVQHILATDISDEMLTIGQEKVADLGIENISFKQGKLDELGLDDEQFDVVLGLNILHLVEDLEGTFNQVNRVTKAGGIFISSTVVIKELSFLWRALLPILQLFNLAPFVNYLSKSEFLDKLSASGFSVEECWSPDKSNIFVIARKK